MTDMRGASASDRLYGLLPPFYRTRDAEQGEPLRALLRILESEYAALEQDIDGLYEDWFIETCAEWVVPYIGDLLELPGLHAGGAGSFSLRGYVANTLAARRRKGTAAVLEQIAGDVSGWRARVVEFGRLLATTQHLNHVQRTQQAYTSVRNADALALLGSPFDPTARTADVRHIDRGRGRYNIANIGIFLWRLQAYEVERSRPFALEDGIFSFDPLGLEIPLFNTPQSEVEITHLAEEINVPAPLRRRPLYRELAALRAAKEGEEPQARYFGSQPPFQIFLDGAAEALAARCIAICDLSEGRPAADYSVDEGVKVLVDPERGLLALAENVSQPALEVSYAYGFSADVGGGPYDRSDTLTQLLGDATTIWYCEVAQLRVAPDRPVPAWRHPTFTEAVAAWNRRNSTSTGQIGVIALADSGTYAAACTIHIGGGNRLIIVAAHLRAYDESLGPETFEQLTVPGGDLAQLLVADGLRPCLSGDIDVRIDANAVGAGLDEAENTVAQTGEGLCLNGLLLAGRLRVAAGNLGALDVLHCTLVPRCGGIEVAAEPGTARDHERLTLRLERTISGPVRLPETARELRVLDSIVDAESSAFAISADPAGTQQCTALHIERSTVRGQVRVKTLEASETLFMNAVLCTRLQVGCTRYSYLAAGSNVPHRFRCQPDLAISQRQLALQQPARATPAPLPAAEQRRIAAALVPVFSSLRHGDPGYMQLAATCAAELRTGAEDGAEIGVFCHLRQPQREANILTSVSDYLRFGMEAGTCFVNATPTHREEES